MENYLFLNKELGTNYKGDYDIDWIFLSSSPYIALNDDIVSRFRDKLLWVMISQHKKLSTEFIEKYESLLCLPLLMVYQKVPEKIIQKARREDWHYISMFQNMSESFMDKNKNNIDWELIGENQELSEDFIERHKDALNWETISKYQKLSEPFIAKHSDLINWEYLLLNVELSISFIREHMGQISERKESLGSLAIGQTLPEEFIEENLDRLNMDLVTQYQILSEEFIERHLDVLDWHYICSHQYLSESFIEKHIGDMDLDIVSSRQKLSEDFMEKHTGELNWAYVSSCQKLSEQFMEKHKGNIDWKAILISQKLSEEFIEKHFDEIIHEGLSVILTKYQKLSNDFINRHFNKLPLMEINNFQYLADKKTMSIIEALYSKNDIWQYKDLRFKKNAIMSIGLYECHDDYFIAYKAIRHDRYSLYNFQYQYLPNETYESTCDCTDNENSFGLNVGTYGFAKEYLSFRKGLIVKCKVYYEDIGRIVYGGEKVRCLRITVMS